MIYITFCLDYDQILLFCSCIVCIIVSFCCFWRRLRLRKRCDLCFLKRRRIWILTFSAWVIIIGRTLHCRCVIMNFTFLFLALIFVTFLFWHLLSFFPYLWNEIDFLILRKSLWFMPILLIFTFLVVVYRCDCYS